jgi:Fur family ferric uptake transcriptional regulator
MNSSDESVVINLMKSKSLSITPCRLAILNFLSENNTAVSSNNIENSIKENFDRVTIYRTLKSFLEIGIIHKIPDGDGQIKYALCKDQCPSHVHEHTHAHFKCTICSAIICLETNIPLIILPVGYMQQSSSLLINGICKNCNL